MTYNVTLTPTSCSYASASGDWAVLKKYTSSSTTNKQLLFTYNTLAEVGRAGISITSVTIHGYVRNGEDYDKYLCIGFRPASGSAVTTWASIDGSTVIDSAFKAIDAYSKSSGMAYQRFTRTFNGSHAIAKWIQQQSALGSQLYMGVIQPYDRSLSTYVGVSGWAIDITYELLGNIPSTDKTSAKLGETVTTTLNRIIESSTTTLNYKIGDTVIASKNVGTATTHAFTIPESAGSAFPNSKTATITVEAVTSVDGSNYGTISTSFTVTLPEDAAPTANMDVSRVWSSTVPSASQIAAYVQKQAGASAAITGSAKYGASIASVKLSVEGSEYRADSTSATFTHLPFTGSGNITLTATVTDTRGNAGTTSVIVNVLPWSSPTIQAFTIQRATETGTIAIDGTCAQADATASVSSLKINDAEKNALTFLIQYREIGATDWSSADAITATDISSTISGLLTGSGAVLDSFNDMSGYEFRLGISDLYATGYASDQMPTKEQFWDVDEATGKMGFGGDAPTSEETAGYRFHKPVEFTDSITATEATINNRRFGWYSGDSITFTGGIVASFISGGTKEIWSSLSVGMPIFATGVSVSGDLIVRGDKGYVDNTANIKFPISGRTVTSTISCAEIGLIQFIITNTGTFQNVTNNRPLASGINSLTITFS